MKDRAAQQVRFRKARDRSLVLLLVGCFLLMPPTAAAFQLNASWNGVPATLIFVFVVWGLLIAGAAYLARSLNAGVQQTSADTTANDDV